MGDRASNPFISSTDQVGPVFPMFCMDAGCADCFGVRCCKSRVRYRQSSVPPKPANRLPGAGFLPLILSGTSGTNTIVFPLTPCCGWQLFQAEVAPVPPQNQNQHLLSPVASVGYSSPSSSAPPAGGPSSSGHGGQKPLNTLDEPVWDTILRDLKRIGANVVLVVFPFTNRDQQSAALRNWDLWGPMVRPPSF